MIILHTSDLHGRLTAEGARRLREAERDLYIDCGDAVRSGNLAVPLRPEPCWPLLAEAGCDVSTLGNRESHLTEAALQAKLHGVRHPILVANLRRKDGSLVFPSHLVLNAGGRRVGLIGAMVPMVTERMTSRHVSAFLWDPPVPAVAELARRLQSEVDLLVAITHIGLEADEELAKEAPELDLILGGHTHVELKAPRIVGRVVIAHTGAYGRYYGRYEWDGGLTGYELVPWQEPGR